MLRRIDLYIVDDVLNVKASSRSGCGSRITVMNLEQTEYIREKMLTHTKHNSKLHEGEINVSFLLNFVFHNLPPSFYLFRLSPAQPNYLRIRKRSPY